ESSARPLQAPKPSHHRLPAVVAKDDKKGDRNVACARHSTAAALQNSRGPSGRIQLAIGSVKNSDKFNATAPHSPASASNSSAPKRYTSQVVPMNVRMNGSRTKNWFSLPASRAASPGIQNRNGG